MHAFCFSIEEELRFLSPCISTCIFSEVERGGDIAEQQNLPTKWKARRPRRSWRENCFCLLLCTRSGSTASELCIKVMWNYIFISNQKSCCIALRRLKQPRTAPVLSDLHRGCVGLDLFRIKFTRKEVSKSAPIWNWKIEPELKF